MSVLSAQTIRKLCLITPFHERTVENGMTFGLGPAGYDIRIRERRYLESQCSVLASSVEHFAMPNDVIGFVTDKSSWARRGVAMQNTIIEPGWRGFLTLEISNHSADHIFVKPGSPIAQIIFLRLDEPTEAPYAGKYQDQVSGPIPAIFEVKP